MARLLSILLLIGMASCANDLNDVDALLEESDLLIETSKNIRMIYSDSAQIRVIISGPRMLSYLDKNSPKQEFPDGVHADFMNGRGQKSSFLESKYAIRDERKKMIHCKDSVVVYNGSGEKLETSELFWDEKTGLMRTDKFIRITQPTRGDTTYGVGFESNEDFTSFKIKNKFSAKMTMDEIDEALVEPTN